MGGGIPVKPVIYAVEDDTAIQELYQYALENEFTCHCFAGADELYAALSTNTPNLILLDIMLPGDDGYTILSRLKEEPRTAHIPIIMVSAKGEELSKVRGLNLGADDYIAKPFGVLELVARIKANLRRVIPVENDEITYKDITIDQIRHAAIANGQVLQTTLKEYNLLCLLCENAEKVQEREVIFSKVWGESFIGETRTLDVHIKELRRKLTEAGSVAVIRTIRGVGYMLS